MEFYLVHDDENSGYDLICIVHNVQSIAQSNDE